MTRTVSWPDEYEALIGRLPDLLERSRLTVGGFSACVDVYLSFHETLSQLAAAGRDCAEGAAMLAELERRALNGIGGELFIDWPDGPGWIDRYVTGRKAIGGTSAQAAYMLAHLGAPALVALEDRSAGQLAVLHPDTLVATEAGVAPVSSVVPEGAERPPHYIFEFTAGERVGADRLPRSSRTIVRFDHDNLQHDAAFVRASVESAGDAGAGILCGFNEMPPERAGEELDYAAGVAAAWRRAGLSLVHVELGGFPTPALRDLTITRLLPAVTSVGMSLSELADLTGEGQSPELNAICLAEAHGLARVCIHADEWALAVTSGDAERELEALEMGCLLASARAAHGYFATPDRLPDGARLRTPPIPACERRGGWSVARCPAPYLEKPAATIGLGDTFLAGTLLVLGGTTTPGSRPWQRPKAVGRAAVIQPAASPPE
jgi:ADP-dependent phosphofructokinase/glucokinase